MAGTSAARRCAFLTLEERGDFVIDDDCALQPLAQLGWMTEVVSWRQTRTAWSDYDLVVIRSCWDYFEDVDGFLDVLEAIDQQTRLVNPLDLVRWNLSKTYLRDLKYHKIPIVRTLWRKQLNTETLRACFSYLRVDDIVIKPVIGANGVDAFRLARNAPAEEFGRISAKFIGRAVMIQPFMPNILAEGEYSLFYFNGSFSHAILKVPTQGEFRSQEERGAEVRVVEPGAIMCSIAEQAIGTLRPVPLYARIDLVRARDEKFQVMELELIEPSLYLRTDENAPARFAQAVDDWFKSC